MAIQHPRQRLANEKFAKRNEQHRKFGKKKVKESDSFKSPISKTWLAVLAFLLIGGGLLELFVGFLS